MPTSFRSWSTCTKYGGHPPGSNGCSKATTFCPLKLGSCSLIAFSKLSMSVPYAPRTWIGKFSTKKVGWKGWLWVGGVVGKMSEVEKKVHSHNKQMTVNSLEQLEYQLDTHQNAVPEDVFNLGRRGSWATLGVQWSFPKYFLGKTAPVHIPN